MLPVLLFVLSLFSPVVPATEEFATHLTHSTSAQVTGPTYYFSDCQTGAHASCVAGNNANAGTSSSAPKRDFTGFNLNTLPAGTQLLFARGGAWIFPLLDIENLNVTLADPLVFDAYGTGAAPVFMTTGNDAIYIGGNWFNTTDDGGYTFRNLKFDGRGAARWGIWFVQNVQGVLFENNEFTGFQIALNSNDGTPHGVHGVTLRNNNIHHNSDMGMLGHYHDLLMEGNTFEANNYTGSGFSHGSYLGGGSNITIRNNRYIRNSVVNGVCQGGNMTFHGQIDGMLIENNYIEQDSAAEGCWLMSITQGYATAEWFREVVVRNNKLINGGNTGMAAQSAPGILVEDNVIINTNPTNQTGFSVGHTDYPNGDVPDGNAIVRNNTACQSGGATGNVVNVTSPNSTVTNNVVITGAAATTGICAREVSTDTTAPTVPTGVAATAASDTAINLSWTASTDATGVTGYRIYRDGTIITNVTSGTTYQDTGRTASTTYAYRIAAYDAAGNVSAQSTAVNGTTNSAQVAGPTYYFSDCQTGAAVGCVAGNNANAGTSAGAPKRDLSSINLDTLPAGTTLLFNRGGAWSNVFVILENMNVSAAAPLTFDAYGTGPAPLLQVASANMFHLGGGWENTSNDGGYVFRNLKFDGMGTAAWGFWFVHTVRDVIIENSEITGFAIGVNSNDSDAHGVTGITLRNNNIHHNYDMGMLGHYNNLLIEDNLIEANNFSGSGFSHGTYIGGGNNITIRNNRYIRNSVVNGVCQGGNMTFHGQIDGMLIEGNRIEQDVAAGGCWLMSITTGYTTPEWFRNTVVRNNKLINGGNTGMVAQSAPGILIEDNVAINTNATNQTAFSVGGGSGDGDEADSNAIVRNNTACQSGGASGSVVVVNSPGSTVTNNVVVTGSAATTGICAREVSDDTTAPTVPTNVTATAASDSAIDVSWTASTDAVGVTGYAFYRNGNLVTNVTSGTTYQDVGLTVGTTYAYRIAAYDAAGNISTPSVAVNGTISSPAETTPPTVSLTAPANNSTISGSVTVSATASDNVGVVGVQFRLDSNNLEIEDTVAPYSMTWDTTQTVDGAYLVSAIARDAAGNTTTSGTALVNIANNVADTTAPTVPTGVTATAASDTAINLSWTASTDAVGVTGYAIYRDGTFVTNVTSGTTYQDTGRAASTTYAYRLTAYDAAGNVSAQSTAVSGTTNAAPVTSTTYYFSDCQTGAAVGCVAGNNANAGTSSSAPKQNLSGFDVNALPAGSQLLFARGGVWTNFSLSLHNLNVTPEQPLIIDAYGSGAVPSFQNASDVGIGVQIGGQWNNTTNDGGYTIRNVRIDGMGTGDRGLWFVQNVRNITLDNVNVTGFRLGIESSLGTPHGVTGLAIRNSRINLNRSMGLLGSYSSSVIEDNTFEGNNFNGSSFNHAIYFSHGSHVIIRNNTFTNNSVVDGVCLGGNVTVHGVVDDLLIDNNTIEQVTSAVSCYGFAVTSGYDTVEEFRNVVIRNNEVINVGLSAIAANAAPGVLIEDNTIINTQTDQQISIWVPANGGASASDADDADAIIRNNIGCYPTTGHQSTLVQATAPNSTVTNNVTYTGTSASTGVCSRAAILLPDTTAPTVPMSVTATAASATAINLSWTASTDATGVTGYQVYRDGTLVTNVTSGTTYQDTGRTASTTYAYRLTAYDAAGNISTLSTAVNGTTAVQPSGPTYYFSDCQTGAQSGCVQGNNANAGTSAGAPKQNISGFDVNALPAGSQILFARGGVYTWPFIILDNQNATTEAPIVFADYGTGNIPVLNTAADAVFFGEYQNTSNDGGYTFRNLRFVGPGASTGFFMQSVHDVLFEGVELTNYGIAIQAQDTSSVPVSRLTIRNSSISRNTAMGILGQFRDSVIENNIFEANNFRGSGFDHGTYLSGHEGQSGINIIIRNNHYNRNSTVDGTCQGGNMTFHGQMDNVLIEGNTIEQDAAAAGCWLMSITQGYGTAEWFRNFTVRGNRLINGGNTVVAAQSAPGILVEDNIIWNTQGNYQTGLAIGHTEFSGGDVPDGNAIVRNNTGCYQPLDPGSRVVNVISPNSTVSNNVMRTGAEASTGICSRVVSDDTTAPTVPTGVTATAVSATAINLSWTASTDAVGVTGYAVYRNGALVTNVTSGTTYGDSDLTASTTYAYRIAAYDAAGNTSAQSTAVNGTTNAAPDATAPTVPTNVTATAASATAINLSWTASTDAVGVTGYRIYRDGTLVTSVTSGTTYQDTGRTASTTYAYRIAAYDAAGNASAQSTAVNGTTNSTPDSIAPTVPTNVSATAASATAIDLSWTASTDAVGVAGYRLYRNGTLVTNVTSGTSYQDTGLTASTTYAYRIAAYDAAGNTSAQSTAVNGTTSSSVETTPPTVSLTAPANNSTVSGNVTISATASDNVGVVGVQFRIDSSDIGVEDTTAPYSMTWNTTQTADGARLVSAVARDAAGNTRTSGTALVNVSNAVTDTTRPTITSVSSNKANGTYRVGEVIDIDVVFSEAVTSTGNITVTLETGTTDRTCSFALTNTSTGTCNYAVQAGDTSSDLTTASITGTIADQAGNLLTNFTPATTLAASKALSIDTAAPTGSLSAPSAGATVSGTTTLTASVADNTSIASVQFRLDGTNLGSVDTTSPYNASWDTTLASNGAHTLTALVSDIAGNTLLLGSVSVTVSNSSADTINPTTALIAPTVGASLSGTTLLRATAADNVSVASVQFTVDGRNVGTPDLVAPYEVSWDTKTVPNGAHVIAARATDTNGNATTSASASITITNKKASSGGGGGGGGGGGSKKKSSISTKVNVRSGERTAPFITLVAPKRGTLTTNGFFVQAIARDKSGIQAMFVSVNGTKKKRASAASIAYNVAKLKGNASVTVTAYDTLGNAKRAGITIVAGRVVGVRYW